MPDIPVHILTTAGFIEEYRRQLPNFPTKKAAFEYVNYLHLQYFLKKKYSNYDSFRQVKKKFLMK